MICCQGLVLVRTLAAEFCKYWSLSRTLLGTTDRTPYGIFQIHTQIFSTNMPYSFSCRKDVALRICGSYKHTLFWMDHTWHRTPWLSEDILHTDYLDKVPHAEAITANIWTRLQVAKQNTNSPLNNTKKEIAAAHSQTCNL